MKGSKENPVCTIYTYRCTINFWICGMSKSCILVSGGIINHGYCVKHSTQGSCINTGIMYQHRDHVQILCEHLHTYIRIKK